MVPKRRSQRGLAAFGLVVLLIAAAVAGGWAYWRFSSQDTAGLEGTWRLEGSSIQVYEFRPSGELACWNSPKKEWFRRLVGFGTWRRDGQHISIRTDRNWNYEGQLAGDGTIQGKMIMRDHTGAVVTADVAWLRE
jgi:hypothetical protein